jgi:hypothetical protein
MTVKRVDGPGKKQLEIMIKGLGNKVGKVGWLDRSAYENGVTAAYVAAIQEYGYAPKNIPPRPFMRITIANKQQDWKRLAETGAKAIAKGNSNMTRVMEGIGLKAAGDVRRTISTIQNPPLKQSTIDARLRKRSNKTTVGNLTKPLVDTGFMLATLTNSVEDE